MPNNILLNWPAGPPQTHMVFNHQHTTHTTVYCKNSHQAVQCELNQLTPTSPAPKEKRHNLKNHQLGISYSDFEQT